MPWHSSPAADEAATKGILADATHPKTGSKIFDDNAGEDGAAKVFLGSGPYNARFQQTMLRIRDPKISVPFYIQNFGMTLIHWITFPQWNFTVYFLECLADGQQVPPCTLEQATKESEQYLFTMAGHAIELTHNHGSEDDGFFKVWNGCTGADAPGANYAPEPAFRGFGHIGFNVDDVFDATNRLQEADVPVHKRPTAGKNKGTAIFLDPDGYRLEIFQRKPLGSSKYYNLSQTMLRVKDGQTSVDFYTKHLGFTHIETITNPECNHSLFLLASLTQEELANALKVAGLDTLNPAVPNDLKTVLWNNVLTLCWNHGTEKNPEFKAHDGNAQPQGFGHIGLIMDDLESACAKMEADGVVMKKRPQDGNMRNLAFIYDPDGYWLELIDRKASFAGTCANY